MITSLVDGLMDVLHDQSLPTIGLLQESFPHKSDFMISISTLFDPRYVFLIYAPILFAFNKRVGHRMIIALTWAEWANQILKWLLAGERPYWYVHERANELAAAAQTSANLTSELGLLNPSSGQGQEAPLVALRQFPVTCELGAGSPSGHAMVTATVWYILIDAYLKNELQPFGRARYSEARPSARADKQQQPGSAGGPLATLFWSGYTVMLLLVSLSRVYLACHFPHQCLAGALLGCLLARAVAERLPMERLGRLHFCLATALMFSTALGTYGLLRLTGFDPLWSVSKAMRWCVKTEYIHLDTTPFFSMMRYLGFCLGAGLAYDSSKLSSSMGLAKVGGAQAEPRESGALLAARRLLVVLVAVALGQFLMALPMPKSNLELFYVISFVVYTAFAYSIAGPVPDLVKSISRTLYQPVHSNNQSPSHDRDHLKQR